MQLAAAGIDDAFAQLVRRYSGQVRGYCTRRCGGTAAGDDVAQEVFVELWRTRARFEPRGKFRAYLFTIAQTRALNAITRRPCEVELAHDLPLPGQDVDEVLRAERLRWLHQKLSLLPRQMQEAVLLRFSAGLDYAEMSEVLKRSQSTVRSRVFHGLMRLRQLLGKEGDQ
jgi:RNA polymerase sigma-70 factor (ECF subfamily)